MVTNMVVARVVEAVVLVAGVVTKRSGTASTLSTFPRSTASPLSGVETTL
jgi:hypothetical protein